MEASRTSQRGDPPQATLRVSVSVKGAPLGTYAFDRDVVTIGRGSHADVPIDNVGVSRCHATIERRPEGLFLCDLGSSNGTYVNEDRVQRERMLDAEDVIRIGRYAITVEGGESLPSVLPPSPSKRPPGMPADGTMILSAVDVRVVHRESYRPSKRTPVQTPASPPDVAAAASQTPAPAFASPWVLIGVPSFLLGVTAGTVLAWLVLGS